MWEGWAGSVRSYRRVRRWCAKQCTNAKMHLRVVFMFSIEIRRAERKKRIEWRYTLHNRKRVFIVIVIILNNNSNNNNSMCSINRERSISLSLSASVPAPGNSYILRSVHCSKPFRCWEYDTLDFARCTIDFTYGKRRNRWRKIKMDRFWFHAHRVHTHTLKNTHTTQTQDVRAVAKK